MGVTPGEVEQAAASTNVQSPVTTINDAIFTDEWHDPWTAVKNITRPIFTLINKVFGAAEDTADGVAQVVQGAGSGIENTAKAIPILVVALVLFVGFYLLAMGKKGKSVL